MNKEEVKIGTPPEAPGTLKQRLELAKIENESKKIELEIAQINAPFYTKLSFYVSVSPLLVTVLGFAGALSSGWFDIQNQKIENENNKLVNDQLLLEDKNQKLANEQLLIEAKNQGLRNDQSALEQRKKDLDKETKDLVAERDSNRQKLEQEKKDYDNKIESMRKDYEKNIEERNKTFAAAEIRRERDITTNRLDAMVTNRFFIPNTNDYIEIVKELGQEDKKKLIISVITDRLNSSNDDTEKAIYLYVLYQGTKNIEYKNTLYSYLDKPVENTIFYNLFATGNWSTSEKLEAIKRTIAVNRDNPTKYSWYRLLFTNCNCWADILASEGGSKVYLDALSIAIRVSNTMFSSGQYQFSAIDTLRELGPAPLFVNVALGLQKSPSQNDAFVLDTTAKSLADMYRNDGIEPYKSMRAYAEKNGVPHIDMASGLDPKAWQVWLAERPELADKWGDPDLKTLRATPEKIEPPVKRP